MMHLRKRGIACEVFPHALKYGKQIAFADKKGIPYVWFPAEDGKGDGEILDLKNRKQVLANSESWMPLPEDLRIKIQMEKDAMQSLLMNKNYVG